MTEDNPADSALATTISEPSMTVGETDMLLFALDRSRAQFAWKCGDLDAAGLRKPFPSSSMTLGGLLKHLALIEDHYATVILTGQPLGAPWDAVDFDADPEWEWRTAADDSPEELYALWRNAAGRCRATMTRVLADGGLDQPAKYTARSGQSPNLRRKLWDMLEEYSRHVGHADLLREAVDGRTGEDPPQS
jgi:hypothetical protein